MAKSKLKSIAATTAFTLATIGTPVFADETTPATTAEPTVTEATVVETPKTAADVKSEVDAQQAIVDATATEVAAAQDAATQADQAQAAAQTDVDTATQAVKDAEVNAANATPENIAANQADQAANLADQAANATETDEVNAEIATQTQTVADAQTAVDTAQANKNAADADVAAKDASVKVAQAAIDGTGVEQAQANLTQAQADVTTASTNVDTATKAVDIAKKADADRQTKIDTATTDVAVKSDAVNTSKAVLTKAQNDVASTTDKLTQTTDAVKKAQDALKNVDTVTIADGKQFVEDRKTGDSDFMTDSGATIIEQSSTKIGADDKNVIVNIASITKQQQEEISLYAAQVLTEIRKQFDVNKITVTDAAITSANNQANKYAQRGISAQTAGHINGDYIGENISLWSSASTMTMYDIKLGIYNSLMHQTFADAPSQWNHMQNNLKGNHIGISLVNVSGELHVIYVIQTAGGVEVVNPNDPTVLQAVLTKAQADQAQAQATSDAAKIQLTQASSDYAAALEAKTQDEKVLADATATPLQTQVAENNLRLAKIALQNAQARQADAQKAVDNFSADITTKQNQLADAEDALKRAKAEQATALQKLFDTQAELSKQQATLNNLNKEKVALLAEKDRLVEEAKALAEELDGYMNAPARLADAQATLTEKQAALTEAQAKAAIAQTKLGTVTAQLAKEQTKLAELQAEYDRLKDLEDKAKNNIIVTLPDDTIIAVPKDAPTAQEKPAIDVNAVKQALDKGQDVKIVDGKVMVVDKVVKPQAGVTVTPTATGEKVTYSRVERAKALPQTGEQGSLLALFGVAVLSSLGLTGARRKRRG